ncbi:hypothetical protein C0993_012199, partial [Termitomyces sp. T159_Od127]
LWCILEGGAMEGKTLEKSKKACLAYYNKKNKDKKETSEIMFTSTGGGSAFTLEGDSDTIAAYLASQTAKSSSSTKGEFAGLASDAIPSIGTLRDIEELEIDA